MESRQILHLYRRILQSAKRFPSKNRDRVYNSIRFEFHNNRTLVDKKKIDIALGIAVKGLSQLNMYSNLPQKSNHWEITLDQNPFPKPIKNH